LLQKHCLHERKAMALRRKPVSVEEKNWNGLKREEN
jgi:hypothetical protein